VRGCYEHKTAGIMKTTQPITYPTLRFIIHSATRPSIQINKSTWSASTCRHRIYQLGASGNQRSLIRPIQFLLFSSMHRPVCRRVLQLFKGINCHLREYATLSSNRYPYPTHKCPTPHQIFHLPQSATESDIKARCVSSLSLPPSSIQLIHLLRS